jgi:hypothetical protein
MSELQLPTGLLSISYVIYEHGEPWCSDIDKGKLIHPPQLSGSHLVANQKELAKEMNLTYKISLSCFKRFFNIPQCLVTWGSTA